jgi:hypothetical protein
MDSDISTYNFSYRRAPRGEIKRNYQFPEPRMATFSISCQMSKKRQRITTVAQLLLSTSFTDSLVLLGRFIPNSIAKTLKGTTLNDSLYFVDTTGLLPCIMNEFDTKYLNTTHPLLVTDWNLVTVVNSETDVDSFQYLEIHACSIYSSLKVSQHYDYDIIDPLLYTQSHDSDIELRKSQSAPIPLSKTSKCISLSVMVKAKSEFIVSRKTDKQAFIIQAYCHLDLPDANLPCKFVTFILFNQGISFLF